MLRLSNNSASNEVYNYTLTTTGNRNGCGEASFNGSITIQNAGTSSSTSSSNTISIQTYTISVTDNNSNNYSLNGADRSCSVSGNDPTVIIKVGDTVNFAVNASGHPFILRQYKELALQILLVGSQIMGLLVELFRGHQLK